MRFSKDLVVVEFAGGPLDGHVERIFDPPELIECQRRFFDGIEEHPDGLFIYSRFGWKPGGGWIYWNGGIPQGGVRCRK